jgi:transcriptional regulator with PAS, ATPase and Fis domain
MTGNCLGLVADDARLSAGLAAAFKRVFAQVGLTCGYDAVLNHVGPDTNGVLVAAVASPQDIASVARLAQTLSLRRFPTHLLIATTEEHRLSAELAALEPYSSGRYCWPCEEAHLVAQARERLHRARPFLGTGSESLEDQIGGRLLAWTPSLLPMVERIALAGSHDVTVLLTGETGTGKTHLARLIHDCSSRNKDRFLVVPCGALAANLVESEFFGHVKGAFTGADRPKVGKFAAAGNGTILLDEIDALPLEQQANLLRVIETGEFEPVGSNETEHCTARIVVASNWNLIDAVERNKFRQDLYYRLNVMSFHLPPLRERVQDIASLARGMANRYAEKFRKKLFDIHVEAMTALEAYNWPGNVRQLENAVQQSVLVSTGPELLFKHLPPPIQEYATGGGSDITAPAADSLTHNREVTERSVIQRALASSGYSRARAANSLGISRVTLYKKMKKYGLMEVPIHPAQAQ